MNGIENITKRIADDAEKQASAIISRAKTEAEGILAEYKEKAEALTEEATARAEKRARESAARLEGVAGLEARKETLAKKQELITRAFDAAVESLSSLPDDERATIISKIALRASLGDKGEIIFSPAEKTALGKLVLGKISGNKLLTVSDETRDIGRGFILKNGLSEVDCTFKSLVMQLRDGMSREVADILFE